MPQNVRDALAKMRVEGAAWCTLEGQSLLLKSIGDVGALDPADWNGWTVLCKTKKGLRVGIIVSRKQTARRPHLATPPGCFLSWKKILARVLLIDERESSS